MQRLAAEAEQAYRAGEYARAASLFGQAADVCAAQGDALQSAEYANNRSVALLQLGDASGALQAAQGTDIIFAQAHDTRRQAFALGNQAAAHEASGRLDLALSGYRACADLLKAAGESDARAAVLKNISALQVRSGHHLEALASMNAALNNQQRPTAKERLLKKLLNIPFKMLGRA